MEKGMVLDEVKKQVRLAWPMILANMLQYLMQVMSLMFVGHVGELSLSGASMATSFANVTGFSLLMGMGGALDTLCGQAFGAKQYHMLGIHMQRAMITFALTCIPLGILWLFTGKILVTLFHQDHQISTEAGSYIRWLIPALFAYGMLQCHIRFLRSQKIVLPLMLSSGITTLLHILVCWVMVFKSGLGSRGAAVAISVSYSINTLLLAAFIRLCSACKATWTGFSREALHDIVNFVSIAIPSASMVCMEFWSFEVLVILCGLLPNPKLQTAVMSICLNTAAVVFTIPLGLGASISTRVSNELGAGSPQAARLSIYIAVSMAILEGLTVGSIMVCVRGIWGRAYSNEREVVRHVAATMPLLALSHLIDGIQCVLSGIARGCGWQKVCACVNLASYYIVGIPTSVILAFVLHIGAKGLWVGIICALFIQDLFLVFITLRADWEKEVQKIRDQVYRSTIPIDAAA
ncbi:protein DETOXIFICATION 16-like [Iris pallida]|uniref:Protein DETOXIFICATION n=1 Tax=Iris pallida TaxID=29817 RepID=A0AAX6EBI6_IRIPA|nr:protein DETOXIFICATION 16-like [Iris pallida]